MVPATEEKKLVITNRTFDVIALFNRKVVPILSMIMGIITILIPLITDWSVDTGIAVGTIVAVLGVAKITLNYIVRLAQHTYWNPEEIAG